MSVDLFEALIAGTIGGGGGSDEFVAGANITITDNPDGTKTIAASGEVSSEDTVARADIANHKADKANPHEVTKAQVGLGNVDNTADLDKPLSTATQTALAAKANSTDVYTKAEVDELLEDIDVPTALSELTDDSTHRLVTDAQKTEWSGKQDTISDLTAIRSGAALGATAVQPEAGKGLSSNDYTTVEKTKLDGIAEIKTIGTGLNLDDNGELTATGGGTGGTTNYNDLSNKPQINGNTLSGNKTGAQLGLASTSDIPTTLAELTDDATHRVVTDTEKATWNAKADAADIPTVPVKGVAKNGTALTPDASGVVNITVPTTAAEVSALPDTTLYGASISLSIDTTTFVVTATLKDQNGDTLGTAQTIDLPLESVVVNGSYDSATKKVVLTLQSGSTIEFSVADLVAGLQSEITSTNKLDADLVDDSTSINKFVSSAEKTAWNNKSDFSGSYNDLTNKPAIPDELSDLSEDSTHRTVSDAEKSAWDAKASTATATTSTAGLMSANDKTKLNNIASGAEANVQSDWSATDTSSDAYIKNKPTIPSASSASPKMDGTASSGSSSYWSRADHVHPTDTSRQAALSASQLEATNSGITNAELVELVDSGAKNLANISFGTVTESGVTAVVNADGSITLNGTRTSSSAYIFQASITPIKIKNNTSYVCKGTNNSGVRVQVIGFSEDETEYRLLTNTNTDITFDSENWHHYYVRILLTGTATLSDVTIYPMCCLKTAWDISQAFVPYSPSNAELYKMIKAL